MVRRSRASFSVFQGHYEPWLYPAMRKIVNALVEEKMDDVVKVTTPVRLNLRDRTRVCLCNHRELVYFNILFSTASTAIEL
jgi:hypothetical protein